MVTPEAVVLEFDTAGLGSRMLAISVDLTIQGAVLAAGSFAIVALATTTGGLSSIGISLLFALGFLTLFGYPAAFETLRRGRTPGKAALGLRVVTREGTPVTFRHAAVRAALTLVDFWLTSGAGAVLAVLLTRDNQRLGDLAAGTLVLRERTGAARPRPVAFEVPRGLEALASTLDLSGLTPSDYATVRSFLVRAPGFPAAARTRLADTLAGTVASRVGVAPPGDVAAEAFLTAVAARYQQRAPGRADAPAAPATGDSPGGPSAEPVSRPGDPPAGGPFTPPR